MSTPTLSQAPRPERLVRLQADGVLFLITAFWGSTFVVVKDALGFADPYSFLALRFLIGAVVLSAMVRRRLLLPQNLRRGVVLGVFLFLGFVLQTVGLTATTPSRSAFITGLCVVFVPMWSLVLFRRVPRVTSLLGVLLAAVGLYYLTGASAAQGGGLSLGDVLTLGCAVAYALHLLFTERYAQREGVSALVAVQLWVVALLSALCLPFVEVRVEWTRPLVGALLFCGVFASAMALSVQTWGMARTSAVRAALLFSLEPVFTAAYSVALGYETLGPREWGGGALIIAGVLVSEVGAAAWDWWRARTVAV
jgi:drug/metabolite transporter (DMT)-like permease